MDSPDIHACSVLPAPIDTPIYQQAANFMGREIRAMWPADDPQLVATAILEQAAHPRRQMIAGNLGHGYSHSFMMSLQRSGKGSPVWQ